MKDINSYLEHTLLQSNITRIDIENHCRQAIANKFTSICIPPFFVRDTCTLLSDAQNIEVWTPIAYPMGFAHTVSKVEEIKKANDSGAHGVEIMINLPAVLDNNWSYVKNDIISSVTTAQLKGLSSKLIFKSNQLKSKDIQLLCKICIDAGADYIISDSDAEDQITDVQSIMLIKRFVKDKIKLQASGHISTHDHIIKLIEAGSHIVSTGKDLFLLNEI